MNFRAAIAVDCQLYSFGNGLSAFTVVSVSFAFGENQNSTNKVYVTMVIFVCIFQVKK